MEISYIRSLFQKSGMVISYIRSLFPYPPTPPHIPPYPPRSPSDPTVIPQNSVWVDAGIIYLMRGPFINRGVLSA